MNITNKHNNKLSQKTGNKVPYPLLKNEPNPIYRPITNKHEDIKINDE